MSVAIRPDPPAESRFPDRPWYVVETAPQMQSLMVRMLRKHAIEFHQFLMADSTEIFPRYIFVQLALTAETYHHVSELPGFLRFLGLDNHHPSPLRPGVMAQLKLDIWGTLNPRQAKVRYTPGEWLRIKAGSFKGHKGQCVRYDLRRNRVELLMSLLGRPTQIKLAGTDVEAA
ncbi:MAG: transcription termination/antitermination NusG family protein [Gallionella sp.]|nr:transcription termination/antitermination NusG family protein [Gallionella sp.]